MGLLSLVGLLICCLPSNVMDDFQLPEPDLEVGEPAIPSPFEWTDDRGQDETDLVVEVSNEDVREAIPIPIAKLPQPPAHLQSLSGTGAGSSGGRTSSEDGTHARSRSTSPALLAGLVLAGLPATSEGMPLALTGVPGIPRGILPCVIPRWLMKLAQRSAVNGLTYALWGSFSGVVSQPWFTYWEAFRYGLYTAALVGVTLGLVLGAIWCCCGRQGSAAQNYPSNFFIQTIVDGQELVSTTLRDSRDMFRKTVKERVAAWESRRADAERMAWNAWPGPLRSRKRRD